MTSPIQVLWYAALSMYRMIAAYLLSLVFSLVIGIWAARSKTAEKMIIPVLDIMQSVPILGFFPVALIFFMNVLGPVLGGELSSIFLIFTSQVWNMTFGVYESVKMIPKDVEEMARFYGIDGWLRLIKITIPSTYLKLSYNSALSWSSGWFFLYASEIISVGGAEVKLPGLGSYLAMALTSSPPRVWDAVVATATILALVVLTHLFVWEPLINISASKVGEISEKPRTLIFLRRLALLGLEKIEESDFLENLTERLNSLMTKIYPSLVKWSKVAVIVVILLSIALSLKRAPPLKLSYLLSSEYMKNPQLLMIGTMNSLRRVFLALIISLAWTLPVAILTQRSKHRENFLLLFELVAAFPIPVLWPFLVKYIILPLGKQGFELAALTLILFGSQFYLLFNMVAGARSIPPEIDEMRKIFGIKGFLGLRKIILPSMFSSMVTGLITAWGGAWNTTIMAEYINIGGRIYPTDVNQYGLGTLLSLAAWQFGDMGSLLIVLAVMVLLIVVFNKTLWRALYNYSSRFRFEG